MIQDEIMVSIDCLAYNHEAYIADAIERFLMQKTNFPFEILIHDDASTDRTSEIIKKYQSKYPDLIKPIYQTENQYSKGVKVDGINNERAKGKYIAICEGDDFWTDPYKLQKQVDYMEKHPECSLCEHAGYRIRPDKTILKQRVRPNDSNKIFTVDEVISGGGGLFVTNSMLYPTLFSKNRPEFFEKAPIGDYTLCIYLALKGVVFYIGELMSAYRVGVPGSWTSSTFSNKDKRTILYDKLTIMLNEINNYTNKEYYATIKKTILKNRFYMMLDQGMFCEAKGEDFKEFYTALDTTVKVKIFIKQYFPSIANILISIRRSFS